MGGNGRVCRVSGRSRGSGRCGGISTVDASITWAKTALTTDPQASVNGDSGQAVSPASIKVDSGRPVSSDIGCANTTLNASSFKGSVSGTLKTQIDTGYVLVLSPVVVVVAAASLYPPSLPLAVQRGSVVWILTFLMLMMATFVYHPLRSNFVMTKFLRLSDVGTSGPISTSSTVPMRILVFLFAP